MKPLLFAFFLLGAALAQAATPDLLERAVRCELQDGELESLMGKLAAQDKGFAKTAAVGQLPAWDLYRIAAPATVHGYSSAEVYVAPTTIALVVDGNGLEQAVKKLKLQGDEYTLPMREVRPGVEIQAFTRSNLPNKFLVGCRYLNEKSYRWMQGTGGF